MGVIAGGGGGGGGGRLWWWRWRWRWRWLRRWAVAVMHMVAQMMQTVHDAGMVRRCNIMSWSVVWGACGAMLALRHRGAPHITT
jgi:hypothetical protein